MKKKILIVSLCSLVLLFAGCKKDTKLKDGKEVVASISGKDFTAEELFSELKGTYGTDTLVKMIDKFITDKEIKDSAAAKEYAEAQIASMKKQYESYGYKWSDVLAQYGYTTDDQLIKEYSTNYRKEQVVKNYLKKQVTEDEINKYYDKEIYGNYTVKHILITPETNDNMSDSEKEKAEEKALATAKEVIKKLDKGEKWATLVKEYSDDTSTIKTEGLLENFTNGDMVDEFFDAVVKLDNNKYTSEPVESTYGYHIILKISNTKKPSLKDSKEKVLTGIVENKLSNDEKLSDNTWIKIRESYKLNINDSTIKTTYGKKTSSN